VRHATLAVGADRELAAEDGVVKRERLAGVAGEVEMGDDADGDGDSPFEMDDVLRNSVTVFFCIGV
jgi:hypothetical protein